MHTEVVEKWKFIYHVVVVMCFESAATLEPRVLVDLAVPVKLLGEGCGYESCPAVAANVLNVHLVPHTHFELGFWANFDEHFYGTRVDIKHRSKWKISMMKTLDAVLAELWNNKERRFTFADIPYFFQWWKQRDPTVHRMVYELVRQNRLTFVGGGWGQSDEASTNYQAVIDLHTFGLGKLNSTFLECGRPLVAWQADTLGHSKEFASLMALMGYDGLFIEPISYDEEIQRMSGKALEFVWRGNDDLGVESDIFTHKLFDGFFPPPGFCFSLLCDDPLIVMPDHIFNNFDERIREFEKSMLYRQSPYYRTRNVMVVMGNRLGYFDAEMWFKNIDKLILGVNARVGGNGTAMKAFYSTPACYLKAVHEANPTLPVEQNDFMPYRFNKNMFATGMYTTKASLKLQIAEANVYFQISKQFQVLAGLSNLDNILEEFKWIMGVTQDHSIIPGLLYMNATSYYTRKIYASVQRATGTMKRAFDHFRGSEASTEYYKCSFNESICINFNNTRATVMVYNPLGWPVTIPVRLPIEHGTYLAIYDHNGDPVTASVMKIPEPILALNRHHYYNYTHEVVFIAKDIPPLGFKAYFSDPLSPIAIRTKKSVIKYLRLKRLSFEESKWIYNKEPIKVKRYDPKQRKLFLDNTIQETITKKPSITASTLEGSESEKLRKKIHQRMNETRTDLQTRRMPEIFFDTNIDEAFDRGLRNEIEFNQFNYDEMNSVLSMGPIVSDIKPVAKETDAPRDVKNYVDVFLNMLPTKKYDNKSETSTESAINTTEEKLKWISSTTENEVVVLVESANGTDNIENTIITETLASPITNSQQNKKLVDNVPKQTIKENDIYLRATETSTDASVDQNKSKKGMQNIKNTQQQVTVDSDTYAPKHNNSVENYNITETTEVVKLEVEHSENNTLSSANFTNINITKLRSNQREDIIATNMNNNKRTTTEYVPLPLLENIYSAPKIFTLNRAINDSILQQTTTENNLNVITTNDNITIKIPAHDRTLTTTVKIEFSVKPTSEQNRTEVRTPKIADANEVKQVDFDNMENTQTLERTVITSVDDTFKSNNVNNDSPRRTTSERVFDVLIKTKEKNTDFEKSKAINVQELLETKHFKSNDSDDTPEQTIVTSVDDTSMTHEQITENNNIEQPTIETVAKNDDSLEQTTTEEVILSILGNIAHVPETTTTFYQVTDSIDIFKQRTTEEEINDDTTEYNDVIDYNDVTETTTKIDLFVAQTLKISSANEVKQVDFDNMEHTDTPKQNVITLVDDKLEFSLKGNKSKDTINDQITQVPDNGTVSVNNDSPRRTTSERVLEVLIKITENNTDFEKSKATNVQGLLETKQFKSNDSDDTPEQTIITSVDDTSMTHEKITENNYIEPSAIETVTKTNDTPRRTTTEEVILPILGNIAHVPETTTILYQVTDSIFKQRTTEEEINDDTTEYNTNTVNDYNDVIETTTKIDLFVAQTLKTSGANEVKQVDFDNMEHTDTPKQNFITSVDDTLESSLSGNNSKNTINEQITHVPDNGTNQIKSNRTVSVNNVFPRRSTTERVFDVLKKTTENNTDFERSKATNVQELLETKHFKSNDSDDTPEQTIITSVDDTSMTHEQITENNYIEQSAIETVTENDDDTLGQTTTEEVILPILENIAHVPENTTTFYQVTDSIDIFKQTTTEEEINDDTTEYNTNTAIDYNDVIESTTKNDLFVAQTFKIAGANEVEQVELNDDSLEQTTTDEEINDDTTEYNTNTAIDYNDVIESTTKNDLFVAQTFKIAGANEVEQVELNDDSLEQTTTEEVIFPILENIAHVPENTTTFYQVTDSIDIFKQTTTEEEINDDTTEYNTNTAIDYNDVIESTTKIDLFVAQTFKIAGANEVEQVELNDDSLEQTTTEEVILPILENIAHVPENTTTFYQVTDNIDIFKQRTTEDEINDDTTEYNTNTAIDYNDVIESTTKIDLFVAQTFKITGANEVEQVEFDYMKHTYTPEQNIITLVDDKLEFSLSGNNSKDTINDKITQVPDNGTVSVNNDSPRRTTSERVLEVLIKTPENNTDFEKSKATNVQELLETEHFKRNDSDDTPEQTIITSVDDTSMIHEQITENNTIEQPGIETITENDDTPRRTTTEEVILPILGNIAHVPENTTTFYQVTDSIDIFKQRNTEEDMNEVTTEYNTNTVTDYNNVIETTTKIAFFVIPLVTENITDKHGVAGEIIEKTELETKGSTDIPEQTIITSIETNDAQIRTSTEDIISQIFGSNTSVPEILIRFSNVSDDIDNSNQTRTENELYLVVTNENYTNEVADNNIIVSPTKSEFYNTSTTTEHKLEKPEIHSKESTDTPEKTIITSIETNDTQIRTSTEDIISQILGSSTSVPEILLRSSNVSDDIDNSNQTRTENELYLVTNENYTNEVTDINITVRPTESEFYNTSTTTEHKLEKPEFDSNKSTDSPELTIITSIKNNDDPKRTSTENAILKTPGYSRYTTENTSRYTEDAIEIGISEQMTENEFEFIATSLNYLNNDIDITDTIPTTTEREPYEIDFFAVNDNKTNIVTEYNILMRTKSDSAVLLITTENNTDISKKKLAERNQILEQPNRTQGSIDTAKFNVKTHAETGDPEEMIIASDKSIQFTYMDVAKQTTEKQYINRHDNVHVTKTYINKKYVPIRTTNKHDFISTSTEASTIKAVSTDEGLKHREFKKIIEFQAAENENKSKDLNEISFLSAHFVDTDPAKVNKKEMKIKEYLAAKKETEIRRREELARNAQDSLQRKAKEYMYDESLDDFIENQHIKIFVDRSTHRITSLHKKDVAITLDIQFHYYEPDVPDPKVVDETVADGPGPHVFRALNNQPTVIQDSVTTDVYKNVLVQEIHTVFSNYTSFAVRLYNDSMTVELDWLVGPVPSDGLMGKEVFIRYKTNLASSRTFYTDANGRQMMKRIRNAATTVDGFDGVAGNIYPVTSRIFIEDTRRNLRFSVYNDRSQGGTSLHDGEIDLMLHRRVLYSNQQTIDEVDSNDVPILVRGKHYIHLGEADHKPSKIYEKRFAKEVNLMAKVSAGRFRWSVRDWLALKNTFKGLKRKLPIGVHLLTLEKWNFDTLLIRFENYLETSDVMKHKTKTVYVRDLITGIRIKSMKETTLSANQWIEGWDPLRWNKEAKFFKNFNKEFGASGRVVYDEVDELRPLQNDFMDRGVKLEPQQIRTFVAQFEYL